METVHLDLRLTHRYRDAWKHLDKSEYVGPLKVTPRKMLPSGYRYEDPSEGPRYVQYARLKPGMNFKVIRRAIVDTMGGSNCTHEFDCCGCASRWVNVTRNRRVIRIETEVSFNY